MQAFASFNRWRRIYIFYTLAWNCGSMQQKESRIFRNLVVGKFLDDPADFFPETLQLNARPEDMPQHPTLLLTTPAQSRGAQEIPMKKRWGVVPASKNLKISFLNFRADEDFKGNLVILVHCIYENVLPTSNTHLFKEGSRKSSGGVTRRVYITKSA